MATRPVFWRALVTATVGGLFAATLVACTPGAETAPEVVSVPTDAETISEAVDAVAEGGLVLVEPGVYEEQVLIATPNITVRGLDRNETVIDAGGVRSYGIVAISDGVSIENLTVTGATFYGVLVTGLHDENGPTAHGVDGYSTLDPEQFPPVERFSINYVTAYNNGLYGLYAFDAHDGVIQNSYASGSADSGIYVGQCENCGILVADNVAENNAVGFENANASDSVSVVRNRFSGNRIGMTFLSNYQEAFTPQRDNLVAGNLVAANSSTESPAHADGGFGIGIGVGAGTNNQFVANRVEANPTAGILFSSTEDLAPLGNTVEGNSFAENGADVANVATSRAPAQGNCTTDALASVLPLDFFTDCTAIQPAITTAELPQVDVPAGMSFLRIPAPPAQPNMPGIDDPARVLPSTVAMPLASEISLPSADLHSERAR